MGAASERPVEADRHDARRRATGPRSAGGKSRSRANGLKHGLAAEVLIPEQDRARYEAALARWEHQAGPDNVAEHHLIRRAAITSVTLERLDDALEETRQQAARDAVRRWERGKRHAAQRKAQDLKADPGGTVADLEATAFGCDWLIRQWAALDDALAAGLAWTAGQLERAQRLLGYPDGRPGIDAERPLRVLWLLAGAMAPSSIGNLPRTPAEAPMPTEAGPARAQLRRFVAAEVDRLEGLRAEAWEAVEGPEYRAVIIRAAAADTTEEGRLRHRYANDADRSHNAAMRLFYQTRGLRRKEYLAIAKEGRQSGKIPRVPVGGGWWREVDSDPAPPGYARVDPIAAAVAPEDGAPEAPSPIAPRAEPGDALASVAGGRPGDPAPIGPGSEGGPLPGAMPGATPPPTAATDPIPGAAPDPSPAPDPAGVPSPEPTATDPPIAPADAAHRPSPDAAPAPGAPRRSEPNFPAAGARNFERNPNPEKPLRNTAPAGPINAPWRTEPLRAPIAGPGTPAADPASEGPTRPNDRRADPTGAPRRSEPNFPAGDAGDSGRNPNQGHQLSDERPIGPIGDPRRTEPLPAPEPTGHSPARRAPDLAASRRHRRHAGRRRHASARPDRAGPHSDPAAGPPDLA